MAMSGVIILALISAAFAAAPAPAPTSQRIVGGSSTVIEEYPYMAGLNLLQLGIFWGQACGGALITSRTILTAAHCFFFNNQAGTWRARLGSSFRSSGGQVIQASQLILHEYYDDSTVANDVAIMVLSSPAVLSNAVQVARIPPQVYNIPDGQVITAIGWGRLTAGGFSPEQLQHVDINVINQEMCADRYVYLSTIQYWPYFVDDGMICAGILDVGGKDACQGDSGGPVTLKTQDGHVVVGVTSWGYGCAHEFYPGVSARTSYYSNWIVQNGSV